MNNRIDHNYCSCNAPFVKHGQNHKTCKKCMKPYRGNINTDCRKTRQKVKNPNLRQLVFDRIKAFIESDESYQIEEVWHSYGDYFSDEKTLDSEALYRFVDGLIPDIKGRQYIEVEPKDKQR